VFICLQIYFDILEYTASWILNLSI